MSQVGERGNAEQTKSRAQDVGERVTNGGGNSGDVNSKEPRFVMVSCSDGGDDMI